MQYVSTPTKKHKLGIVHKQNHSYTQTSCCMRPMLRWVFWNSWGHSLWLSLCRECWCWLYPLSSQWSNSSQMASRQVRRTDNKEEKWERGRMEKKERTNSDWVYFFFFFYLRFNLKGEVGIQITQFHLVVKQHWVVTVFWRSCSLKQCKTEKQTKSRMLSQHKPSVAWHTQTICSADPTATNMFGVPGGFRSVNVRAQMVRTL